MTKRMPAKPGTRLTTREQDIVLAILEGCTNGAMAARFGIGEQSVKNRLSSIYRKVGVSSRLELALLAMKEGLVNRDQNH